MRTMEEFERHCYTQDYHIYEEAWVATVGEELVFERELGNTLMSVSTL